MPSKRQLVTSELCFALEKAGLLDFSYNNYALVKMLINKSNPSKLYPSIG